MPPSNLQHIHRPREPVERIACLRIRIDTVEEGILVLQASLVSLCTINRKRQWGVSLPCFRAVLDSKISRADNVFWSIPLDL